MRREEPVPSSKDVYSADKKIMFGAESNIIIMIITVSNITISSKIAIYINYHKYCQ